MEDTTRYQQFIDEARNKAVKSLQFQLRIDHNPTVEELLIYLDDLSEFHHAGKMGIEVFTNKEALRLAAVYLRESLLTKAAIQSAMDYLQHAPKIMEDNNNG